MKKIIASAFILLLAAQISQAQSTQTEKRDLRGFTKVAFALSGDVLISLGNAYSIELEGDRDYLREVKTEVVGNELRIRRDKWFDSGNKKVTVRITMPALEGISVSGSGRVTVKDPLRGDELDVAISGSGRALLHDVALGEVECSISGSGSLIIAGNGTIKTLELSISGSGGYQGEATGINVLEARISGSGSCDCHVKEMLRASISGSGNIMYSGNPKIDASVSGSGKVRMK